MNPSSVKTVDQYLAALPPDRRTAIEAVRKVIRKNLPRGYEEAIGFGMITYQVPLSRYPNTYNGQPLQIAALASQKTAMSVYLVGVYGDPALSEWFQEAYRKTGKKLDMGKSCVRFRTIDDLPLELVGEVIGKIGVDEYLAQYEASRGGTSAGAKKAAARTTETAAKKAAVKKPAATKAAVKKPAATKTGAKKSRG